MAEDKKVDNSVTIEIPGLTRHEPPLQDEGGDYIARVPPERYLSPAVACLLAEADEFRYEPMLAEMGGIAATVVHDGALSVLVGKAYCLAPPEVQAEMLLHECGHFVMGHMARLGDRDAQAFNMCTDAALHHAGVCDWELVDREIAKIPGFEKFQSCTFDRLKGKNGQPIPPMLAEAAYELLDIQKQSGGEGQGSCGSLSQSRSDETAASRAKWHQTAIRVLSEDKQLAAAFGKKSAGNEQGSRPVPELKAPRPWIRKVITYLVRTAQRTTRSRSYRRENRAFDMLPGQSMAFGRGALFLLDASGSITEEMLTEFLSAIVRTPELRGSYVVVFDTSWTAPIPVVQVAEICKAVAERGGGTAIAAAGHACRVPHLPAVWVTDAYTGDGWPKRHVQNEVWCVYGDGPTPPTGVTIRIPKAD